MQIEQVRTKQHTNDNDNDNTYIVIGIEDKDDAVVVAGNWKKIYTTFLWRERIYYYTGNVEVYL